MMLDDQCRREAVSQRQPTQPLGLAGTAAIFGCGLVVAAYAAVLWVRWQQPQTLQDFSAFWTAGRLALMGKPVAAYDWVQLNDLLYATFGKPDSPWVRTFYYPPTFFLVAAPLALLPFAVAAAVWLGTSLAVYLAGLRAVLRDPGALVIAAAAPVVMLNCSAGQNGLLAAGLFAAALAMLDARPVASGILIGLLSVKPHFGLLLPPFLAVTGRWRVFASAAATVAALAVLAAAAFGWAPFAAFAGALPTAADGYLEHGSMTRALPWSELQSVYGTLRAIGLGNAAAWWIHGLAALAAAVIVLLLAAGDSRPALPAAALAIASFLVTPYSELNDVALLMVPWAFLYRDGVSSRPPAVDRVALALAMWLPLLYLAARLLLRAGGLAQWASWVGMGPLMCALLAAVVGRRLYARQ
jgi:alpha-1,2-mannosyltransferase